MSKKCPWCKVDVYLTEFKHWWRCPKCQTEFPESAFSKEQTLFDRITQSEERLAETYIFNHDGKVFKSLLLPNMVFKSREEAHAATVAKLQEVAE